MGCGAQTDHIFFHPGISGGFLARLFQERGEVQRLELAKDYMGFVEDANGYLFGLLRAGKVGRAVADI